MPIRFMNPDRRSSVPIRFMNPDRRSSVPLRFMNPDWRKPCPDLYEIPGDKTQILIYVNQELNMAAEIYMSDELDIVLFTFLHL